MNSITFIIDASSRMIVGYSVCKIFFTEDTVIPAMEMAVRFRKGANLAGLIFHPDGVGQYYSKKFKEQLLGTQAN